MMDRNNQNKVLAIVQARMGSTRLPEKVLAPIAGRPLIEHLLERIRPSHGVDRIVLATTLLPQDDVLADVAARLGFPCFRGSVDDVLDRYYRAALEWHPTLVVRLTADNPLVDAEFIDVVLDRFLSANPPVDYLDTTTSKTFPYGLSVEVFTFAALEAAWREDTDPARREHVTPFIRLHPDRFRLLPMAAQCDDSDLRWTVDTAEDLAVVRKLYDCLSLAQRAMRYQDVVAYVRAHPELAAVPSGST